MNNQPDLNKKLRDFVIKITQCGNKDCEGCDYFRDQLMQLFKDYALEVIGTDDPKKVFYKPGYHDLEEETFNYSRNEFRAELREKVKDL